MSLIRHFGSAKRGVTITHKQLLSIKGKRTVDFVSSRAGQSWLGLLRNGPDGAGLEARHRSRFAELREEFWKDVNVPGSGDDLNQASKMPGVSRTSWNWRS